MEIAIVQHALLYMVLTGRSCYDLTHISNTPINVEDELPHHSNLSRADLLDPLRVAADRGEVLVAGIGDQDDILDANAAHALVALEDLMIDVLRVADRSQEVRGEVNARLHRLFHVS